MVKEHIMNKFEQLKAEKIKTVGELIERLQQYPANTKLQGTDADIGGYDVSTKPYLVIGHDTQNDILSFGHNEYAAYEAQQKKEITYEQYLEIVEEDE